MSRVYRGHYRVLVAFTWPTGAKGYDYTSEPQTYEQCEKDLLVLGMATEQGRVWRVVDSDTGEVHDAQVERARIIGPLAHSADLPLAEVYAGEIGWE